MKKEMKDHLKSLSVKELQAKLIELNTEKVKQETKMFREPGTSMLTRNTPKKKEETTFGNLRRIKKDMARVKTWLNMKLANTI